MSKPDLLARQDRMLSSEVALRAVIQIEGDLLMQVGRGDGVDPSSIPDDFTGAEFVGR
jgi:hypothetical protein